MKRPSFKMVLAGIIIVCACAWGGYYLIRSFSYESTDDAYVTGIIVPVSAEVRGKVVGVFITDNQAIKAGDTIAEIEKSDYLHEMMEKTLVKRQLESENKELTASVEEATRTLAQTEANLDAAVADEVLADKDVRRYSTLFRNEVISQSQYDTVQSRWKVAKAKREAAEEAVAGARASLETIQARLKTQAMKIRAADESLSLAQLNLTRTTVKAPVSGRVAMKNVDPGKYVEVGQPLLSIVTEDAWVVANFKETQIKKMLVGQPATVKVDAYPGRVFEGHVDSLQHGTGSVFTLLPPDNATGNFVKVVQRVPVKIVIDSPVDPVHPLRPGLSVVAEVNVGGTPRAKIALK
jgi:membrane fusion protein (multidrug efflux system)